MIRILVALGPESRPLAKALQLGKVRERPFPTWRGSEIELVQTGVGPLSSACAAGWIEGVAGPAREWVNLGCCGGSPSHHRQGGWYRVHKVTDATTGKSYFPDILRKHPFEEAPLRTFPEAVTDGWQSPELVDMEAAGFLEAVRAFAQTHQVHVLKRVSDYCSGNLDFKVMGREFAGDLQPVADYIMELAGSHEGVGGEPQVKELATRLASGMRLSVAQTVPLENWLGGWISRGGDPARLDKFIGKEVRHKRDRNRLYEELIHVLKN